MILSSTEKRWGYDLQPFYLKVISVFSTNELSSFFLHFHIFQRKQKKCAFYSLKEPYDFRTEELEAAAVTMANSGDLSHHLKSIEADVEEVVQLRLSMMMN